MGAGRARSSLLFLGIAILAIGGFVGNVPPAEGLAQLKAGATGNASTPWPELGFDSARTGTNPSETTLSPRSVRHLISKWAADTSANFRTTAPAIAGGVVYAASSIGSTDGNLEAFDTTTGSTLWTTSLGAPIDSSPAVDGDKVYVGAKNNHGGDTFFAINASDGTVAWHKALGVVDSSPLVANGIVYVGSDDTHAVYALDETTGSLVWSQATGGMVSSSPSLASGVLYVGSSDHHVYAFDASTGTPTSGGFATRSAVMSTPVVANGVVYVVAGRDLYAANAATGAILWRFSHRGMSGQPAVSNGVVYVELYSSADLSGHLLALDSPSGIVMWQRALLQGSPASPSIANGVVYAGTLEAFNAATGHRIWSSSLPFAGNPSISDGTVYVGSAGVHAFSLPS